MDQLERPYDELLQLIILIIGKILGFLIRPFERGEDWVTIVNCKIRSGINRGYIDAICLL